MNVDLQWCPCGKQARENDMYCSDICHFLEQYPNLNRKSCDEIYQNGTPAEYEQKYEERSKSIQPRISRISSRKSTVTPFGACQSIPQRLSFRSRQRINNQYSTFRAINALSSVDYFNQKSKVEPKKCKINSKGISKLSQGLKKNMVSHSNYYARIVNLGVEKSQDKPLIVY
ncbi:hypothetical protein H8356DRAFT_1694650 [Neocallimastix lanati (nom. inval.)]|jgi:hypothetical protein|uniref:Uncharacterized protein n=1 Tax=Neocallimastix californiae TaxID=1754190 RepID=A0A1Y2ECE1_9FUNG|nr:hypothetical protein H8356DRAFT_1694650 [Neocallimastix sp. JGI-2020a]ORY69212.1 hypothetical protein LY90DRAFT_504286 [Neocallimastix californiae]|eukprot:ORY69212.1 hypothetical protein LY90DRAFT_504286 [Neocallimastix californiae]